MLLHSAILFGLLLVQADTLSLSGTIFDPGARPLGEVRVRAEELTELKQWEATTESDGNFRFDRLPYGTYRLTIEKSGYFNTSTEIRLESSQRIEFTLAAAKKVEQDVDVVSRLEPINTDSVSPQVTVNNEVVQNIVYPGRLNFTNALALMPGVLRDNSGQLHILGGRTDQIRYQLDGMNLTNATAGGLAENIPLDAIESIDLDLAGYAAEFGKGSGGVVRVHSQLIGDKYRFNVTDFVPSLSLRRRTISEFSPRLLFSGPVVRDKVWFMYSGTFRYARNWVESLPAPANTQRQTLSDEFFKLQWNVREAHVVSLDVMFNTQFSGNDGLSVIRPLGTTTNSDRHGTTLAVSDRHVTGGKLLETMLQWTRTRNTDLAKGTQPLEIGPNVWTGNYYVDQSGFDQRWHASQSIAWEKPKGPFTHRFEAGGEFDYISSSLQLDRRAFQLLDSAGDLRSSVGFAGPDFTAQNNQEYGAFVQDRIIFNPALQMEAGLRYDHERIARRNNFAPRLGFSFLPRGTPRSKISGGVGVFYDNITLLNIEMSRLQRRYTTTYNNGTPVAAPAPTSVQVSPDLRDPYSLHWNMAWENEWAPRWVSRVEYIQKTGRQDTRLAAAPAANGFDMLFNNSGKSDFHAVKFILDRPVRTDLRLLASYTYSNAKARPSMSLDFPDPAVEAVDEVPVEWNTTHRFLSWGYFPLPRHLYASFAMEARSGFPFTAVDDLNHVVGPYNGNRMPTFFSTDASLEKQLPIPFEKGKRVAVRIGVTNLFNHFNPRTVDPDINSLNFLRFTDSSRRHFVLRLRLLKS